ncbi:waprin-Phi3-like isoform X2 [Macrobrachium nipponense]|uniref:waprin-Phi3-like isoform X2 n=1 Tax=Macrobrachium nipponense TaxID=159736 RepID=UPI0030C7E6D1
MGSIRNHCLMGLLAIFLVLGTITEHIEASPSPKRPPTAPNGCPLLPAPPPGGSDTGIPRTCETDKDCRGHLICCPTGACCGTYCYDPRHGTNPHTG